MTCRYCGGAKRIQIVSSVSDHAWADCFCNRPAVIVSSPDGTLEQRLRWYARDPIARTAAKTTELCLEAADAIRGILT